MIEKNHVLAILVVGQFFAPSMANAQYDYLEISYPGQNSGASVWGVNDRGDIVAGAYPDRTPFVYSAKDGTTTDVVPLAGFHQTQIVGINDVGEIVGLAYYLDVNKRSGIVRSKNGEYTIFDHPDAQSFTTARGINNQGLITGTYNTAENPSTGFLYDPKSGTFTDLVPSSNTIAHGINSKGVVVGSARFEIDPCGGGYPYWNYGWVRAKDGSVVLFQINGLPTTVRGINDAGMIVGSTYDPVTFVQKGYIIKAPETDCEPVYLESSELLQYPGADETHPEGITNSGDIVGIFRIYEVGYNQGFVASPQ